MTTGYGSNSAKSEIINLLNPRSTCKNWIDYPIRVYKATGQFIDNDAWICGGWLVYDDIRHSGSCFKLGQKSAIPLPNLANPRGSCSAGVFNNSLFITGGSDGSTLRTTEYVAENSQKNGVALPESIYDHCTIQVTANEILLTGGGAFPFFK